MIRITENAPYVGTISITITITGEQFRYPAEAFIAQGKLAVD